MELIARFQSDLGDPDSPITYSLHCRELGIDSERFEFVNPLTDKDLAELQWYLEQYWQWPTGPDYARAHKLESEMQVMGNRLWQSLFGHADAIRVAQQLLDAAEELKILTIDSVAPRVLRLPWELLADEDGHVFNADPPIVVRRRLHKVKRAKQVQFSLPLRVLMVISRPDGVGFLDPRSSAVALLDALAPLGDLAQVEFLRPPTVKALTTRLTDPHKPPVHVVHFDGHGVYEPHIGLGYLLFENDEYGQDPVNANRLGTLLNQARIPLMVLDACQTGEAGDLSAFTGVAARLIQSGVGSVLAMNYSVLVETTRRLTAAFYRELARGRSIGQSLDKARFDLLADTGRHRIYRPASDREEIIQLHDWFLPSLYQQQADPAPFAAAPALSLPESAAATDPIPRLPARGGFPPEPRHGFHGRARELLALERLFAGRRIVVLHGFGGQGKTALATHAAAWLLRTGLFRRAVFLSLEQGGGLELALSELGHALLGQDFNIHQGEPVAIVAGALAGTPTLLVWDNFESILPAGDAALPPDDVKALLDAGARWANQGDSRLLLTTRDTSFGHQAFEPGATTAYLPLAGLAVTEALELAGQILGDRGIERPPRSRLQDLLRFLGGHPLSLQLVLPHLADPGIEGDVGALIDEFEKLLPGFVAGKAAARNESLTLSLDFSLRRLGEDTRALLPALGVFRGQAMEDDLLAVTEFDETLWLQVRDELRRAGLVTVEHLPGIQYPYIHFHPTLCPHLARFLSDDRRAYLEERFRKRYHDVATFLYHNDSKDPIPTRAIAVRELPNLRRALDLHLIAGDRDAAVDLADRIAKFLNNFGRWRERDALLEKVTGGQGDKVIGGQGDTVTKAEFTLASRRGETLLSQGRAGEAEGVFRKLLVRMDAGVDYDTGYDQATTLARLGRSLRAQGRAGAAEAVYRQELAALAALEQSDDVRRQTGAAHTDLADVLADQGRYAEARAEYEAGLDIARAQDDARQAAVVQGQLGTLALRQRELAEAQRRYQEALASFRALGEERSEAILWHQLGMVAEEGKDWAEAERCYRQSLAIKERIGDKALAASTCNQLAMVAQGAGRPAQAERWYRRAIDDFEVTGMAREAAVASNNLAALLLTSYDAAEGPRPHLDAAERYALKALKIDEAINDPAVEIWKDYSILAEIAERKGDEAAARAWRRKAQETYAAFPGHWANLQVRFGPVVAAVVDAERGTPGAKKAVEELFGPLTKGGYMLEEPVRRIWAGERDIWALTEGLDRTDALIVRKILEVLAGGAAEAAASPAPSQPSQAPQEEGISLQDILALVVAGCQGDLQKGQQAYEIVQAMQDAQQPQEIRDLGVALQRLLFGRRHRDEVLAGLPPQVGDIVDVVLSQLS